MVGKLFISSLYSWKKNLNYLVQNLRNPISKTVFEIGTFSGYSKNELQHVEKDARRRAPQAGKPLLKFAGSVMEISHDRRFLDRTAIFSLAFERNSQAPFFDGTYQEYDADKKKQLSGEGAKQKRIRYKPLRG
jgi:hypothetical protein